MSDVSVPPQGTTRVPSFSEFHSTSLSHSRAKSGNTRCDTTPERTLRCALWRLGLRFRKHVGSLPGKPDVVFSGTKVAVFCDGDFWHGRNWEMLLPKLERGANARYWCAKIQRNRERDAKNAAALESEGWFVVRLWETDIKRDPSAAAQQVRQIINARERVAGAPRSQSEP